MLVRCHRTEPRLTRRSIQALEHSPSSLRQALDSPTRSNTLVVQRNNRHVSTRRRPTLPCVPLVSPSLADLRPTELLPLAPRLSDILIHRFWSREAYLLHPDVLPALRELHALPSHDLLPGIVSGSDRGIVKVLKDLEVVGVVGGIREEDVWTTWEIEAGKETPLFWSRVLERLEVLPAEVLVVGDDLVS